MAQKVTAWVGWAWFGAFVVLTAGLINAVSGFVAIFSPSTVVSWTGEGIAVVDVSTWGWVHLVLGALLVLVGFALFAGSTWARRTAIVLVVINLVAQFVSLPVTPWWSLVVIALDLTVLWALIVHGDEVERASR